MRAWGTPQYSRCAPTPEGSDERRVPVHQAADGAVLEVVMVIMRDDDGVDGWHIVERQGWLVPGVRAHPGKGRRPAAKDGVGEDANAIDLDDDSGVPQPREPQPR